MTLPDGKKDKPYVEQFGHQALQMVGKAIPQGIECGMKKIVCAATLFSRPCRECLEEHYGIVDRLEDRG